MTEKRALVTGAARRLGRSMAVYLAGRGHDITLWCYGADEADAIINTGESIWTRLADR